MIYFNFRKPEMEEFSVNGESETDRMLQEVSGQCQGRFVRFRNNIVLQIY